MKKGVSWLSILLCVLVITSCKTDDIHDAVGYAKYVENESNGFHKKVICSDFIYDFQYKPAPYIILKEQAGGQPKDSSYFNHRLLQLKHTVWFNVSVRAKKGDVNPLKYNVSGLEEYNQRLTYFLASAENNFRLTYGSKQDLPKVGYFFENNYGLTPMDVMVVGFRIPDDLSLEDITIEYDDELFNNGIVKAKILKQDIAAINKLYVSN